MFLFFLEEKKRKEVRVQCSLGRAIWWREEQEKGEKTRTGRGMDGAKEVQHSVCFSQKTSCIVKACLQLFGGTSPSCCHLHQAPSLYFNVFLMDFLVLFSFGAKKGGYVCITAKTMKELKQ